MPDTPHKNPKREPVGPAIAIVVVVIIFLAGGAYFFYEQYKERQETPLEEDTSTLETTRDMSF